MALTIAALAFAFFVWLVCVVIWTGPDLVASHASAVGKTSIQTLGMFGDSFGVVTAFFSAIAVILVYLTYNTQKEELNHLREHLAGEQRRQRASQSLARLEEKLQTVALGNLSGLELIAWMNGQLEEVFPMEVALGGTPERKWTAVLDGPRALPDVSVLAPAVYSLLGLARVYDEVDQATEANELADLVRSLITTDALLPLLYASAMTLRGRRAELGLVAKVFEKIEVRPVLTKAFDLSVVPGGVPLTLDDTLQ